MRLNHIPLHSISISLFLLLLVQISFAHNYQDTIKIEDFQKFTYDFDLQNGTFTGPGGDLIREAIAASQYTLLGDNKGSRLEQQFTAALIKELDKINYKHMALEAGVGLSTLLNKLAQEKESIPEKIKELNQRYALRKTGKVFTPILEFKHLEGAQHFQEAAQQDWTFLSVGVTPWTSYAMLTDELFIHLTIENQKTYQSLKDQTQAHLALQYDKIQAHNSDEVKKFIEGVKSNSVFEKFLDRMSICEANNDLIKGIRFSLDYWEMYGNKEFYQKNMDSAKEDKIRLAKELNRINFDYDKDKLFVKMWRNHLAKGHSIAGTFGVGNMLLEMAAAHSNKSLTMAFIERFAMEDESITDILTSGDVFSKRYLEFVQLGKIDKWVVIDLRPFNKSFYYGSTAISESVYKMLARFDMLLIPKADTPATPNY